MSNLSYKSRKIIDYIVSNPWRIGICFIAILFLRIIISRSYTHWDTFDIFTSNFVYLSDSLRNGILPLWNPFVLSGNPLLENLFTNSLYSPIDLILLLVSLLFSPIYVAEYNTLFGVLLFFIGIYKCLKLLKFHHKDALLFSCIITGLITPAIAGQVGFIYSFSILFWGIYFVIDSHVNFFTTLYRSIFLMSITVKGYFYFIVLFYIIILLISFCSFVKSNSVVESILVWLKEKLILFLLPTLFFIILNLEGALEFIRQYKDLGGDLIITEPRLRQLHTNTHFFYPLKVLIKNMFYIYDPTWNRITFSIFSPFIIILWGSLVLFWRKVTTRWIYIFVMLFFVFMFLSSDSTSNRFITINFPLLSLFRWNFYHSALSLIIGVILAGYGLNLLKLVYSEDSLIYKVIRRGLVITLILFTCFNGIRNSSPGGRARVFYMNKDIRYRRDIPFNYTKNKRILLKQNQFKYDDYSWLKNRYPISHGYNSTVSEFYWRMKDMPFNGYIAKFSCNNHIWNRVKRANFKGDNQYVNFLMSQISSEGKFFVVESDDGTFKPDECLDRKHQGLDPELISLQPNILKLSIKVPESGVIVITQQNKTGWKAYLNGKLVDILHVNRIFQGVYVEKPGQYTLILKYWPQTASWLIVFYVIIVVIVIGVWLLPL